MRDPITQQYKIRSKKEIYILFNFPLIAAIIKNPLVVWSFRDSGGGEANKGGPDRSHERGRHSQRWRDYLDEEIRPLVKDN